MLFQLEHSEAELAICSTDRVSDMVAVARACANPVHVLDVGALPTSFPEPATALTDVLANEETECAVLYMSGTTGQPKGCLLTNEYFMTAGRWYLDSGGLMTFGEGQERVLSPLPLFHMNALAITVTGTFLYGNCLIDPDRFHPKSWWQDVAATRQRPFIISGWFRRFCSISLVTKSSGPTAYALEWAPELTPDITRNLRGGSGALYSKCGE